MTLQFYRPNRVPTTQARAWLALVGALSLVAGSALSGCAQEPMTCIPNATRPCSCVSGSGVQECTASGLSYTACRCATPDSGVVMRDVPTTNDRPDPPVIDVVEVDQPNPDVPSMPCAAGPENTVAACTDGCSNDGDNFVDCNDFDCCNVVACGPNTSCGRRGMCTACDANGMCGAGLTCARRRCDAVAGCYPADPNASCTTIAGVACPRTAAYDRCIDDGGCGPNAVCSTDNYTSHHWGVPRCSYRLGGGGMASSCDMFGPNPCPQPPPQFMGVSAICELGAGPGFRNVYGCTLRCTPGAMCPYGLRCVVDHCVD
jgi:hypothetical protein